jgi:hypothetical protein
MILKWVLRKQGGAGFIWLRIGTVGGLVNKEMNLQVPYKQVISSLSDH